MTTSRYRIKVMRVFTEVAVIEVEAGTSAQAKDVATSQAELRPADYEWTKYPMKVAARLQSVKRG